MERPAITTDCHIPVPYSLVEELPEAYRAHFARLERRDDATYVAQPTASTMGMVARRLGPFPDMKLDDESPEALARIATGNCCDEARPSFDAAELLADLERDGVMGAVLIPGAGSAAGLHLPDEVAIAYCQVVNDWLAETWGPYLDRVAPGFQLPVGDIDATVKELERAAGLGLRPALLPDGIWDRPYFLPEWEPVWEAANALKIPISVHTGISRWTETPPHLSPGQPIISFYNVGCAMGETLGWFVFSGIFDRYPDLHVVCTEGYAGWLAHAMSFFDHHWQSRFGNLFVHRPMAAPSPVALDAPPSYYLKRQAHATFMWDPAAINNRTITGLDCLMWGNDYPHWEGAFPFSQEWIDKEFAGVPDDEVDAMIRGNAARVFQIDV